MDGSEVVPSGALGELEIFSGEILSHEARVYIRVPRVLDGVKFSATIRGPKSIRAHTLPATFRFRELAGDTDWLAEAVVTEPCFWAPGSPYLYDVRIERSDGGEVASLQREFGIRPLGTRDKSIFLCGKRWVCRGVTGGEIDDAGIQQLIETKATLCVPNPSDELCRQASQLGLPLAAVLSGAKDLNNELRRVARYPAVVMAIIEAGAEIAADTRGPLRNLLLAERIGAGQQANVSEWADVVVCEVNDPNSNVLGTIPDIPVVLWKNADEMPLVEARADCDRLQRDFAAVGDFAGYVVDSLPK